MKKKTKSNLFVIAFCIFMVFVNGLIIVLLYKNILLTSLAELLLFFVLFLRWKSRLTLIGFIFGGIVGAGVELFVTKLSSAWVYANPNLFNAIPFWLILAWGNATICLFYGGKNIEELLK